MKRYARLIALALVALLSVQLSGAQETERARAAAESVKGVYGTAEGLTQNGVRPLSTTDPMRTVRGDPFNAQLNCPATQRFLRVTMLPSGTSDIARLDVELDRDVDGTAETARSFTGPFAGVCNNGLIRCDPGTWNNCRSYRWAIPNGVPILEEVLQRDLGACYCVNASCGANLLMVNSNKVVSDVGAGLVTLVQRVLPRITTARTQSDELSIAYFGQASGCGVDRSPEQFFSNPNALAAAGVAERATPGTVANFILGTSVAADRRVSAMSCEIRRELETSYVAKNDILRLNSSTRGIATDCGPGCIRFQIGDAVNNLYGGGSGGTRCRISAESQRYLVGMPDRIDSVTLQSTRFDDAIRLKLDGTIAYNTHPSWTAAGTPEFRCNYGEGSTAPNSNLTSYFSRVGTVAMDMEIAHDRRGEGWMVLEARVREGCEVEREDVVDGCAAAAANTDCSLYREVVDGVETVRDYRTTGLSPLPTTRLVGTACQQDSGMRNWWVTQREYRCRTRTSSAPDMSALVSRYDTIHQSINPDSGAFTDRRTTLNGVQISSERLTMPAASPVTGCTRMCRTRRLRPGVAVADGSPQSVLNQTGVAYDFTFKECDASNRCPLEPGEEIASACDCRSNFAQAAAMMQTIRQVRGDTVCTAP